MLGGPSYRQIAAAAGTSFAAMLVGGWVLWVHCDLVEFGLTGFHRAVCEGPIPSVGVLLVLFAPLATAVAGLVSLEHDRTTLPFYSLWIASLVLGATLLTTALMLDG